MDNAISFDADRMVRATWLCPAALDTASRAAPIAARITG